MNDSTVVGQAPKFEFKDSFDCLNDLCDVPAPEPEGLSSYLIPAVLGSFVKENTFKNLKNSCHQTSLLDSCTVEEQLIDSGATNEALGMPISQLFWVFWLYAVTSSSSRLEEAERIETNKGVFAWIDALVISNGHMSETMTTTSPVTNNLIDLFTTNLFVGSSSPRVLSLALAHLLPAHNSSRISILDFNRDYSSPPISPDLKHTTIKTSSSSAPPTGDPLQLASGGGPNPSYPCLSE
ncbi:hypothetical protein L873DRAFT_1072850 [Choiromyces venosus 120613-1]|uniref:Uncharacterized protein n=1 Tax=Choiromyces venosus 120613-1 TaxID=1336337 RepID=A0A3N4K378_9PEZI|nr:hypothetical protein L873DRAFT_1072850 [Choiromyces venosus 120613-1]